MDIDVTYIYIVYRSVGTNANGSTVIILNSVNRNLLPRTLLQLVVKTILLILLLISLLWLLSLFEKNEVDVNILDESGYFTSMQVMQVSPVTLQMPKFTQRLKQNILWFSEPFCAFEGGYQMCLKVYAAGYGEGEGTHVSVYLFLMKGPHDDKLEQSGHWPLRGTFTIELLNQLDDKHHVHTETLYSDLCIECNNRVRNSAFAAKGWGNPHFISHATILHQKRVKLLLHKMTLFISEFLIRTLISFNQTIRLHQLS